MLLSARFCSAFHMCAAWFTESQGYWPFVDLVISFQFWKSFPQDHSAAHGKVWILRYSPKSHKQGYVYLCRSPWTPRDTIVLRCSILYNSTNVGFHFVIIDVSKHMCFVRSAWISCVQGYHIKHVFQSQDSCPRTHPKLYCWGMKQ